jgi:hypothetical protein
MSDLYVTLADLSVHNVKDFIAAAYCADVGYSVYDPGCYNEAIWEMYNGTIRYGNILITQQQQTGGGEGSGEYMDVVWKIHDDDNNARYFKQTGRYYSFVGGEWNDDMKEVFPRQVEVTVYE